MHKLLSHVRRLALLMLVSACIAAGAATTASAQETDPDVVPAEGEDLGDVPEAGQLPATPNLGDEVVHSWALTPAGNNNESGASSRSELSYTGDPGTVIEDAVTLFNLGNEVLTFRVYATDAVNDANGQFALLDGAAEPLDVGSWVTVEQELVTVAPGRVTTIPITIEIPAGARPGDHVGGILASNEALSTNDEGSTVLVDRRTGTRLFLRVSGPLIAEVSVDGLTVDYSASVNPLGGDATVTYSVENRGNVRLSGDAVVSVAGPFGIGRQTADPVEFVDLLPGQSVEFTSAVEGVPALVTATGRVEVSLDESSQGAASLDVRQEASTFAPPITLGLLALFILFALLALRASRRHSRRKELPVARRRAELARVREAESEQLVS